MPSAFSLEKKLNLLLRHPNCGSGGYTPSDKVGVAVSKKLFWALQYGAPFVSKLFVNVLFNVV